MYTETKVTAIMLDSDEVETLTDGIDGAKTDNDGNPVLEVRGEDGDLIGSVVFHAGIEASELTE